MAGHLVRLHLLGPCGGKISLAAGRVLRSCKVSYFRLRRPVSWFSYCFGVVVVAISLERDRVRRGWLQGLDGVVAEELSAVLRAWCFRARCRLFGVIGILLLA